MNGGDGPLDGFADRVELANAAYGQAEVLVTPLQMALVAATIANDGVLMRRRLVDRLVDDDGDGACAREPACLGRVMSSEDRRHPPGRDGPGGRGPSSPAPYAGGAKVPGVRTAGKSGTAQLGAGRGAAQLVRGLRARASTRASPSRSWSRTAAPAASARCPSGAG